MIHTMHITQYQLSTPHSMIHAFNTTLCMASACNSHDLPTTDAGQLSTDNGHNAWLSTWLPLLGNLLGHLLWNNYMYTDNVFVT
mmetsp:Transcript_17102/g.36939  ORF Transcript_17102/g.36939 Transcript_17102/m.36939 type:complete len:84 (-) Transcript_17102:507-758(-)